MIERRLTVYVFVVLAIGACGSPKQDVTTAKPIDVAENAYFQFDLTTSTDLYAAIWTDPMVLRWSRSASGSRPW